MDIKTAEVVAMVPSDFAEPFPIALSPDGRTADVGGADSNVRISVTLRWSTQRTDLVAGWLRRPVPRPTW